MMFFAFRTTISSRMNVSDGTAMADRTTTCRPTCDLWCVDVCHLDLVRTASGAIFNNAAQAWNHDFYWKSMKPGGGGAPTGPVAAKIDEAFGSFEKFKEEFSAAAAGHFGSGWVWLCYCKDAQKAVVCQTHDAGNPIRDSPSCVPLITCDVWEHAYYIDRRNDRSSYVRGQSHLHLPTDAHFFSWSSNMMANTLFT